MSSNKPKIRFKEFTDDWEQRKLSDFGKATGGTSIESEFSDKGIYKVISIGSYSEQSKYNDQGIRAIHSEKTRDRILNKDDLTIILNDKTASGNIIGRALLIDKSNEYVYNQRTERIETDTQNYNSDFLYQLLNAPIIRNKIIKQSQGNTQIFVNWTGIQNTEYDVPQKDEQKKIGEIFNALDSLITLHQQKYNNLRKLKKSLLDKMFPKKDSDVPQIRFKGFTDAWEQRKFQDVGSVAMCKRIFKNETSDNGEIPFYKIGTFGAKADSYISKEKFYEYKRSFPYPNTGDILLSASGTIGRIVEFNGEEAYFQDSNIVWLKHNNNIKNRFLKYLYPLVKWDGIEGSTIKRLYNSNFLNTEFNMPNEEEQERIGELFNNIDNLITLHQKEFDKLQKIKKSLLNKMFV